MIKRLTYGVSYALDEAGKQHMRDRGLLIDMTYILHLDIM